MTRQAPQYGEYATPEEVREALGQQPAPPEPGQRIGSLAPSGLPVAEAPPVASRHVVPGIPGAPLVNPARRWDQFVTVALVVMGVWNVVLGTPGMLALDQGMRTYFATADSLPGFVFGEPTRIVGQVMAALLIMVLVGTVLFSWRRLRAGKLAFWVPLVGAAIAGVVMLAGVMVVFIAEPGLFEALVAAQPSAS